METLKFYINGEWVEPNQAQTLDVINPATEQSCGRIALGNEQDVNAAVAAAKAAFPAFSQTSREERIALLEKILAGLAARKDDLAEAITAEMGAPAWLSKMAQSAMGAAHFNETLQLLKDYEFESDRGSTRLRKEPIGVCALITPWNWPLNQIACKVAPALAAGCTMVLKPSEVAPFDAAIFTEVLHEAGVPAGVFNMVNGDGPGVGAPLSSHPDVDMVSFTGSTRAGRLISKAAADDIKRVSLELGGKSANIILPAANLEKAVSKGVQSMMMNSGQSCNAPSRMLVPAEKHAEAVEIAKQTAAALAVNDPHAEGVYLGPVSSDVQFEKIQGLIQKGIDEGAELVIGGTGKPEGLEQGYYVKPTVFANANNQMTIAREEIFGPVLTMIPYSSVEEAVEIANDTPYGLSGYVYGETVEEAAGIANQLRTGNVHLNGSGADTKGPFGGYKQSGNGREWGEFGLEEFLEVKAVFGANS
ncbi:aldehyde dehydrogenase family protein [Pseudoteredinibacter isoporae]|uniref:aldehyde dehydrogenase family protein n=1 Tax=Pseudoteredinibacter isoporae TaxID=570281 RepID=UPI0031075F6B